MMQGQTSLQEPLPQLLVHVWCQLQQSSTSLAATKINMNVGCLTIAQSGCWQNAGALQVVQQGLG
jgi:hypothetical protein